MTMEIGGHDFILPHNFNTSEVLFRLKAVVKFFSLMWPDMVTESEHEHRNRWELFLYKTKEMDEFVHVIGTDVDVTFVFETIAELRQHAVALTGIIYGVREENDHGRPNELAPIPIE